MSVSKLLGIAIVFCILIVVVANASAGKTTQSQDVRILERRMTVLEQRLYSIESSINRLEQSALSQRSAAPAASARDTEMNLIREEIRNLTLRVTEIECGLLKLDERTATGGTRKGSGTRAADPCRVNPTAPVRLSTRP